MKKNPDSKNAQPPPPVPPKAGGGAHQPTPAPVIVWTAQGLLAKAQRYVEHMFDFPRDDWRYGFWSSLALEHLLRASIANVNPALLADCVKGDWNNLYYALGHLPKAPAFVPKSIDISECAKRALVMIPGFEQRLADFSSSHIHRRNAELHSDATPFDGIASSAWQPQFYETCGVLLHSMGKTLEDLFGSAEAAAAEKMIKASKDQAAKAVNQDVARHKQTWNALPPEEKEKRQQQAEVWATRQIGHRVVCPVCACPAIVKGSAVAAATVKLNEDLITEVQEFLPNKFECVACGIKISGLPKLHACNLANVYKSTTVYDATDYYVGRAAEQMDWEPDNND